MTDLPVNHLVHCPDCDHGELTTRDKAASKQGRHSCPNCNRGMATVSVEDATPEALSKVNLSKADPTARTRAQQAAD